MGTLDSLLISKKIFKIFYSIYSIKSYLMSLLIILSCTLLLIPYMIINSTYYSTTYSPPISLLSYHDEYSTQNHEISHYQIYSMY